MKALERSEVLDTCGFIAFTEPPQFEDTQQPQILLSNLHCRHTVLCTGGSGLEDTLWNIVHIMKSKTYFLMMALIFTTASLFNLPHEYLYANDLFYDLSVKRKKKRPLAPFWVALHFYHRATGDWIKNSALKRGSDFLGLFTSWVRVWSELEQRSKPNGSCRG